MLRFLRLGIQGDRGSGCERACKAFCAKFHWRRVKILYLISTENVLSALEKGKIDMGIFAVKSSKIGLVKETQLAMRKYSFKKIAEMKLEMDHALLGRKTLKKEIYEKIVSHPQALKAHRKYLEKAYPQAKLTPAKDTALPARHLSAGKYNERTLVLAPKGCAKIYKLKIIEKDLPTNKGYITTFYLAAAAKVERR